jgi:hypothetical protein
MAVGLNSWNEALRLRSALVNLGVEEGEIAFPEPDTALGGMTLCLVSQGIDEAPAITPTQVQALQTLLGRFRIPLGGRSIRMEAGAVDLFDGDSGDFLVPWAISGCSA